MQLLNYFFQVKSKVMHYFLWICNKYLSCFPSYWLTALLSPCWEKSGVSAEALCMLCYCSSRLSGSMHLLLSLAQKQIQYSSKWIKTEMLTRLHKPAMIKHVNTNILYVFNLTLLPNIFAANLWWSITNKQKRLHISHHIFFKICFVFIAKIRVLNFLLMCPILQHSSWRHIHFNFGVKGPLYLPKEYNIYLFDIKK